MRLKNSDFVFKSNGTIRFDGNLLFISVAKTTLLAHIDQLRNLVRIAAVYDWERVDRNQNFVAFAVNSDCVVVVLVSGHPVQIACSCWSELNIDVFRYTRWNHALFGVLDLELRSLGRQYMQPLWRWADVDHPHLESVSFVCFKPTKLHDRGRGLKNAVGAYSIKGIVQRDWVRLDCLSAS